MTRYDGMTNFDYIMIGHVRDVCQKKRENVGILKKQGGGGLPESHFHFFTVFNMGDLPKINGKIGKKFPNRGEGGGPRLGKNSNIFPLFFLADVPYLSVVLHIFYCLVYFLHSITVLPKIVLHWQLFLNQISLYILFFFIHTTQYLVLVFFYICNCETQSHTVH